MALGEILVIEDDEPIRRGVADALRFAGYRLHEAADGRAGLDAALGGDYDLVLLDLLLPEVGGLEVLGELRRVRPSLPVIVLTARGEERDRVRGLRLGADDYIVKPFSADELLARIEAVLRRSPARPTGDHELDIAGCRVDFDRREVHLPSGECVALPEREADLLAYLARNAGRAVSRDELLQRVWQVDPRGMRTRTVDMAVARLRETLGDDPAEPRIIATVRGKGYMLVRTDAAVGERGGGAP